MNQPQILQHSDYFSAMKDLTTDEYAPSPGLQYNPDVVGRDASMAYNDYQSSPSILYPHIEEKPRMVTMDTILNTVLRENVNDYATCYSALQNSAPTDQTIKYSNGFSNSNIQLDPNQMFPSPPQTPMLTRPLISQPSIQMSQSYNLPRLFENTAPQDNYQSFYNPYQSQSQSQSQSRIQAAMGNLPALSSLLNQTNRQMINRSNLHDLNSESNVNHFSNQINPPYTQHMNQRISNPNQFQSSFLSLPEPTPNQHQMNQVNQMNQMVSMQMESLPSNESIHTSQIMDYSPYPIKPSTPTESEMQSYEGEQDLLTGTKIFKCPKTFCSKTYKNANGLKYHLETGKCEMDSASNEFAFMNSLNNMDDIKQIQEIRVTQRPYMCHITGCMKKYKNLNGLKYHAKKTHSDLDFAVVKGTVVKDPDFLYDNE